MSNTTNDAREANVRRICTRRRGDCRLPGHRYLVGRNRRWEAICLAHGTLTLDMLCEIDREVARARLLRPVHVWIDTPSAIADTIAWSIHHLSPPPHHGR